MIPNRTFFESLNDATEGFIYVVKNERNMRIHFLFAFMTLLLAIFLGVSRMEWMVLCLVTSFVLIAEMLNTAVEEMMDVIHKDFHPAVKMVKHICAGTVLIAAINAILVGYFIFIRYFKWPFGLMITNMRYTPAHITLASLLIVIFFVIFFKAFFHAGTPLRGGIVSGHSAFAFCLWTSVVFSQDNLYVDGLAFVLAILVCRGRLTAKIHTHREVVFGALLGALVTSIFYKIFFFAIR